MLECKNCTIQFRFDEEDRKFLNQLSPVFDGKKYLLPEPSHCPDCRQQRRLANCNEFNLYQGKCNLCGKRGLTEHAPHDKRINYCKECWHSDKWDSRDYAKEYDFNRSFFEQFVDLCRSAPLLSLIIDGTNVNCDYIHYAGSSKNCYLIMHADFCENCMYGYGFKKNISCMDGFYNLHSELCYDCIDVYKCYGLKGCQDCTTCNSSAFLRDCIGCTDCFLCIGLRNKKYCFRNEQLSKEDYEKKMAEIDLGSYEQYQKYKKELENMEKEHSFKQFNNVNVQNSFGDHLKNCKNAKFCFDCEDVENAKYCYQLVLGAKNCYDIYQYGTRLQESYESAIVGADSYHLLFTNQGHMASTDLLYCYNVESSKNCFGCTNMHNMQYCILNKQYTKEEYEDLVPRIIEHMKSTGEWGEYFDIKYSMFSYNKTTAQIWYPMTKEQVLAKGWKWDDYESPAPQVEKVIKASELSDNIQDVGEEILNYAIECEKTGKLFKITKQELSFYKKNNLPLPRKWWFERHIERFNKRNPRKFYKRVCEKCNSEILSTFDSKRGSKVLCEKCYHEDIY
jgi:hypothetical protein